MPVLEARELSIRFGGLQALLDVSLEVGEFEIVGLIGPNGAGKTTCFNCITGFYRPQAGRVLFKDEDVSVLSAHERSALGGEEVVEHGRALDQTDLLKRPAHSHRAALVGAEVRHVLALEEHAACLRPVEAGDAVEARCLARTVGTDQPHDLELVHAEVDVGQRLQAAEADRRARDFKDGH
jgi:ATPase subunit of ABC transporter with duplicated ATPase domains